MFTRHSFRNMIGIAIVVLLGKVFHFVASSTPMYKSFVAPTASEQIAIDSGIGRTDAARGLAIRAGLVAGLSYMFPAILAGAYLWQKDSRKNRDVRTGTRCGRCESAFGPDEESFTCDLVPLYIGSRLCRSCVETVVELHGPKK